MENYANNKFVFIAREEGIPKTIDPVKDLIPLHGTRYLENTLKGQDSYTSEETEDIYNNFPSGYHSLDAHGVFVRMNNTELEWLGYSREELIGKIRFIDILSADGRKKFKKNFPAFKKTGALTENEYEYQRKDGTTFPVLLSANAVYDTRGRFTRSRTIVFNISDRKQMEFQLLKHHRELLHSQLELQQKNEALNEANEKLFMVNREKDRFIGMASHDLRTPLVSILMLSELLLQDYRQDNRNDKFDIAKTIHDAAVQMQDMISDYLNVNRIESGHLRLHFKPEDITQLTKVILSRHEEIARRKNITIFYITKKQYILQTDAEAYTQIIENLVSNAIKYTHPGKNIYVRIYSRFRRLCIAVEDEGVGIEKKEMHLLFRKFQKLSSRPTAGELSTGLGLSIVKFLADQLGARINVRSKPGAGSIFVVCFIIKP
jgi:PAS domain S-box-containing protein